jgi:hypothetical protein
MSDLVVTWPKSRTLASYLAELEGALWAMPRLLINFHVPSKPSAERCEPIGSLRCYRVHDGMVRGYTNVHDIVFHEDRVVARVKSDPIPGHWPAGWYVQCYPYWHACGPVSMNGFQGYHYFDRGAVT